jgi:hypothetical protein
MDVSEAKRLKALEEENAKLKKLLRNPDQIRRSSIAPPAPQGNALF